jgi:hypothetical protein
MDRRDADLGIDHHTAAYWRLRCLIDGHLWIGTAGYGHRKCLLCGAEA